MPRKTLIPTSRSWLAFYVYCFLIGLIMESLKAPFWAIMVMFLGLVIVHALALNESYSRKDQG